MSGEKTPLLKIRGMTKNYGVVRALDNVDFDLYRGEVHALMGENGAGKSTLAKMIAGVEVPTSGEMEFDGKKVRPSNPREAIEMGIAMVSQEFNSIPDMTVYENVFLGHKEMFKGSFVFDKKKAISETSRLLSLFGMEEQVNPEEKLGNISVAEQQIVEIIKAVSYDAKLIILDEPTASLSEVEAKKLFDVIRTLEKDGVGCILVTHRFNEIFEISDRITVLRDGKLILGGSPMKEMDEQKLVRAMVGRDITDLFGEKVENTVKKDVILKVEHLSDGKGFLKDISMEARKGEILGLAGLVGAGRTELVRCIFGADSYESGTITVEGKHLPKGSPRRAIKAGIALATENRKEEGLLLDMSITENSSFAKTAQLKSSLLPHHKEEEDTMRMVELFQTKIGHPSQLASSLSGGNQQKVVLAKWILTEPKVLIVDEPTRGIDISAKADIYTILKKLAASGISVIMVSSELPEIIGICDRIIAMKDGEIVLEMENKDATEELIMGYASFGKDGAKAAAN